MLWLAVALGGSLGAILRYAVAQSFTHISAHMHFPMATFTANIVGSFAMGVLFVVIVQEEMLAPPWRHFLMVGMLGAFTTFSTFSIEALLLVQAQQWHTAALYVGLSIVCCLTAVGAGFYVTDKFI